MIAIKYVASLTTAEQESHDLLRSVVDREVAMGPEFMAEHAYEMKTFAATVWAAAFARAEEVLKDVK